jgi:hypothetical protein
VDSQFRSYISNTRAGKMPDVGIAFLLFPALY